MLEVEAVSASLAPIIFNFLVEALPKIILEPIKIFVDVSTRKLMELEHDTSIFLPGHTRTLKL